MGQKFFMFLIFLVEHQMILMDRSVSASTKVFHFPGEFPNVIAKQLSSAFRIHLRRIIRGGGKISDCEVLLAREENSPKAQEPADDWLELSDISGNDLWESKTLQLERGADLQVPVHRIRDWDVMIPMHFETVVEALERQRFQDTRFVFQAGVHVNPG